jgi:hypothetical protein
MVLRSVRRFPFRGRWWGVEGAAGLVVEDEWVGTVRLWRGVVRFVLAAKRLGHNEETIAIVR